MSQNLGLMIEGLVAVLLMVTIAYCTILNRRLKRLRADEQSLKGTIAELITATEIAERAVQDLKRAAYESEGTLGKRLKAADQCGAALDEKISSGEAVLARLSRVVTAARLLDNVSSSGPDPKEVAAAARSFADRLRERVASLAA